jgi:multicomponent Na+:H+ antiporter subunit C
MEALGQYNYWIFAVLMSLGIYITMSRGNLVKKVVGLNVFQASVFLLYISSGKIWGATAPILVEGKDYVFSNPLPHVLILTAIVVGVATTAIGLALVVRIKEAFGTVEEDELLEAQEAFEEEMRERAGG